MFLKQEKPEIDFEEKLWFESKNTKRNFNILSKYFEPFFCGFL